MIVFGGPATFFVSLGFFIDLSESVSKAFGLQSSSPTTGAVVITILLTGSFALTCLLGWLVGAKDVLDGCDDYFWSRMGTGPFIICLIYCLSVEFLIGFALNL
jgi:hypothetical protein